MHGSNPSALGKAPKGGLGNPPALRICICVSGGVDTGGRWAVSGGGLALRHTQFLIKLQQVLC